MMKGYELFQREIPILDGKFQINKPTGGEMVVDIYNDIKKVVNEKITTCTMTNLPAYKKEMSATNQANLAQLYFHVNVTFMNANKPYEDYYIALHDYFFEKFTGSMVKNMVKELKLDDKTVPLDDRLKKMDSYIKETISLDDHYDYKYEYKDIFKVKKMTENMSFSLYKEVLEYIKVPYKYVCTTDKFENQFDNNRVVPGTLTEYLLYVPETKKYFSPQYYWMPYGPAVSVSIDNEAAFYEPLGGMGVRAKLEFSKIPSGSMNDNVNTTESEIQLAPDMETVSVKKKTTYTGYSAFYYRSAVQYVKPNKIKDFIHDVAFDGVDTDIKKYTIENKEYHNNYDDSKPFTINAEVQVKESWLENAGKNYIISIGKVLGEQPSLYQETERINPIVLSSPKKFIHTITFKIAAGYVVNDLKSLEFNKEIDNLKAVTKPEKGKPTPKPSKKEEKREVIGKFSSTAKLDGDTITISIEEFYNFVHLDKEKYNEYRDVINASFDFSKATVLLTKV